MHYGIAVSPGIAVAPAYCLDELLVQHQQRDLTASDVTREFSRFDQACEDAAAELHALIDKVSAEIGEQESAIFQAHLFMLRDRALISKVKSHIVDNSCSAEVAVQAALAEYEQLFGAFEDEYLRERLVDLRDVIRRIESHLTSASRIADLDLTEPAVLVAKELFPSQTAAIDKLKIAAIVTERGAGTSHAAIIARSMGIPAVSGISDILQLVKTGDLLAVDGREGCVIVNPGPEAAAAYRKLQREFFDFKDYLIENRDQAAVTTDGTPVELLANINNSTDAEAAAEVGAKGVGLFRTEYIFMTHPSIPDEEEQYRIYKQILESTPNRRLTIRTLDLGGDKTVPYLGTQREPNPFMGWRSIRLSFDHPEFFRKQIRAILRAGVHGDVRMMFPMITTVEELRKANRMVWQMIRDLEHHGIAHGRVKTGMMVEVPAAAITIDHMLPHVDFVSIGTNDLVQYMTAADRDNPKVAHLCEPLTPAVLRVLKQVIDCCNEQKVPVTVCGEMAGRPRCVLALLAFGLRSFSMSPSFVPIIKELVHSISRSEVEAIADEVLRRRSSKQIRDFLHEKLQQMNPRLAMLEHR